MNNMAKIPGLRARLLSSFDTRFETLEIAGGRDKSLQAQLGGRLRKVFAPPTPESTPEAVKLLLQKLEEGVDRKA